MKRYRLLVILFVICLLAGCGGAATGAGIVQGSSLASSSHGVEIQSFISEPSTMVSAQSTVAAEPHNEVSADTDFRRLDIAELTSAFVSGSKEDEIYAFDPDARLTHTDDAGGRYFISEGWSFNGMEGALFFCAVTHLQNEISSIIFASPNQTYALFKASYDVLSETFTPDRIYTSESEPFIFLDGRQNTPAPQAVADLDTDGVDAVEHGEAEILGWFKYSDGVDVPVKVMVRLGGSITPETTRLPAGIQGPGNELSIAFYFNYNLP